MRIIRISIQKKGLTLIELIVAIALLAIVGLAFFSMFTTGIKGISNSGKNSKNVYEASENMEKMISNKIDNADGVKLKYVNVSAVELYFPNKVAPYEVKNVSQIEIQYDYAGSTKILATYTTK